MKHKLNILVGCLSLLILVLFFRESTYFPILVAAVISLFLVILSFGILFLRFEYFYPAVYRNTRNEVILTFDDGPDPTYTNLVLDILQQYNIKALFFLIGDKAQAHPEIVHRIISEGHQIGNHTQTHPIFFALYSRKKIGTEIDEAAKVIESFTGKKATLFRPPIGYMNPSIASSLKKRNLRVIGWNVRSYDSFKNKEQLLLRLVRLTKKKSIVLMHDNLAHTTEVLEEYIRRAQSNGIIFANEEQLKKFIHEINN
ncbi:Peptidoglycan-N-acetylglucosamine deacetylase [compost metagenome]